MVVKITSPICSLKGALKCHKSCKLPEISARLSRLIETGRQTGFLEWPVNGCVDMLQLLCHLVEAIVIRSIDRLKSVHVLRPLIRVRHLGAYTMPVETAVTPTRAISVAHAVVEHQAHQHILSNMPLQKQPIDYVN